MFRAGESLDLLSYYVNTTVVRGVELKHHLAHVFVAIDSASQGQHRRSLSGSGRAIEQKMGQPLSNSISMLERYNQGIEYRVTNVGIDKLVDGCKNVLVTRHVC